MRAVATTTGTEVLKVLRDYTQHLGISLRPAEDNGPLWDGHAMQDLPGADDLAHEIAHWLIASPEERALQNYGWYWDYQFPAKPTGKMAHGDEIAACVLGFSLLVRSGMKDVDRLYGDYGFYYGENELEEGTADSRRGVQSWVDDFMAWMETR